MARVETRHLNIAALGGLAAEIGFEPVALIAVAEDGSVVHLVQPENGVPDPGATVVRDDVDEFVIELEPQGVQVAGAAIPAAEMSCSGQLICMVSCGSKNYAHYHCRYRGPDGRLRYACTSSRC